MRSVTALLAVALLCGACGSSDTDGSAGETRLTSTPGTEPGGDELFPEVIAAEARPADDGTWTFDVTVSSPYDTPARYADAWRVITVNGLELGVRELAHDHAGEQPFTRSLSGVAIPEDVTEVVVEGRDQRNGWGGATVTVVLAAGEP